MASDNNLVGDGLHDNGSSLRNGPSSSPGEEGDGELTLEQQLIAFEPMDFQEEELALSSSSAQDTKFDVTIGHIEDIIISDDFQTLQNDFMEKHYQEFEDTEENKFVYTDIHKEYCELIECYINMQLKERISNFSMEEFSSQLSKRKSELEGEVFEMLLTFSDFLTFKEVVLDYRNMKEGKMVDFSEGITITSLAVDSEPAVTQSPKQHSKAVTKDTVDHVTKP